MTKSKYLHAIGIFGLLVVGGPVIADDGDVQHARILLEEARTFGVPDVEGLAAGRLEIERRSRREERQEELSESEKRWNAVQEIQSLN